MPDDNGRDFSADDSLSIETVIGMLTDVHGRLAQAEANLKVAEQDLDMARRVALAIWQHVDSPTSQHVLSSIRIVEADTAGAIRVTNAIQAAVVEFMRRLMS